MSAERYGFMVATSAREPGEETVVFDYRSAVIRAKADPLASLDEYAREFITTMNEERPIADLFKIDPNSLNRIPSDTFSVCPSEFVAFSGGVNHKESGKRFVVFVVVATDPYDAPRAFFAAGRDVGRTETSEIDSIGKDNP